MYYFLVLLCSLCVASCGTSSSVRKVPDAPQPKDTAAPEPAAEPGVDDPLALLHRELTVPELEWKLSDAQQMVDLPDEYHSAVQDTSEDATAPGWRVQIGSLQSQVQAGEAVLKANEEFQKVVYLEFDAPLYKIRVGDCLTRQDAEDLLSQAIRTGYRDAWIIRTDIFIARAQAEWRATDKEGETELEAPASP